VADAVGGRRGSGEAGKRESGKAGGGEAGKREAEAPRRTHLRARREDLSSIIGFVELAANLAPREIAWPGVGRSDTIVRVHVDVGEARTNRVE
jgi:hypothetical protein